MKEKKIKIKAKTLEHNIGRRKIKEKYEIKRIRSIKIT
jgi:hypothetical protein